MITPDSVTVISSSVTVVSASPSHSTVISKMTVRMCQMKLTVVRINMTKTCTCTLTSFGNMFGINLIYLMYISCSDQAL